MLSWVFDVQALRLEEQGTERLRLALRQEEAIKHKWEALKEVGGRSYPPLLAHPLFPRDECLPAFLAPFSHNYGSLL